VIQQLTAPLTAHPRLDEAQGRKVQPVYRTHRRGRGSLRLGPQQSCVQGPVSPDSRGNRG
jgi:hypothetical protein